MFIMCSWLCFRLMVVLVRLLLIVIVFLMAVGVCQRSVDVPDGLIDHQGHPGVAHLAARVCTYIYIYICV